MGQIEGRGFIENQEHWVERPSREKPVQLGLSSLYQGLSNSDWSELLKEGVLETEDFNGVKAAGMIGTPPLRPGDTFMGKVNLDQVKTEIVIEVKKVLQIGDRMSHRDKIKLSLEVTSKTTVENEK